MFGKCQRCSALGSLETVGTLDPETMKPVVLNLCRACAPLYLRANRSVRRAIQQGMDRVARHGGKVKTKVKRPRDDAKRIRPKKAPTILPPPERTPAPVPTKPPSPIITMPEPEKKSQEKRSKGGIILP